MKKKNLLFTVKKSLTDKSDHDNQSLTVQIILHKNSLFYGNLLTIQKRRMRYMYLKKKSFYRSKTLRCNSIKNKTQQNFKTLLNIPLFLKYSYATCANNNSTLVSSPTQ